MKLSCRDSAQFLTEFAPKMASRIFVPMEAPLAEGSTITLHIRFQDGEVHVKGKAEVIKAVIAPRAGVHVRFSKLDPDSLQFSLTRTSTTQPAFMPKADEQSTSSETYIPPMTAVDAAGAPIPLPGAAPAASAIPLPAPKPSSPKPVSSLLADAPPPRPSSPAFGPFMPKPASSLLDPPPSRPSSPKPVSSLLADAPPPKPAFIPFVPKPSSPSIAKTDSAPAPAPAPAPKPASSLLSDAPLPKPSSPSIAKTELAPPPKPSSPSIAKTELAPPPRPSSPSVAKAAEPAPAPKPEAPAVLSPVKSLEPAPAPPPSAKPSSPPVLGAAPASRPSSPSAVRDSRPLDRPPSAPPRTREKTKLQPQRSSPPGEVDDAAPRSSRLPLLIGVGIVVLGLVAGALYLGLNGGTPKPTKAAAQSQPVLDLLKKMDEQMMAGRYAGPGGDTALDSLRIAVATAPENVRVKEYQQKLVSFFERRVEEAIARSDHAEAAVQLIALSLADPKRDGVPERLKAEEDQVKNQAARPTPK